MEESTVTVRFGVKDPDTCCFISDNVEASTKRFFEFGEYATIELDIVQQGKELTIRSARFVPTRKAR